MDDHRNLLILGVNELLACNAISLMANAVPGKPRCGHRFAEFAGHPSVILWSDAGCGELQVSVWWKYNHEAQSKRPPEAFLGPKPLARHADYPKLVGVVVSGWLERKTLPCLQGFGREHLLTYTRTGEAAALAALPRVIAAGYAPEGAVVHGSSGRVAAGAQKTAANW